MNGYPRGFLPLLLGTLLLMFASGLLLAPTTLALRLDWSVAWRLPGTGRVAVAALHAAGGFVLMLLVGALWSIHMRARWHRRPQRTSGLLLGGLILLLALTAVAVYYLGEESLGTAAALLHLGTGLAVTGPLLSHWLGRSRTSAVLFRL